MCGGQNGNDNKSGVSRVHSTDAEKHVDEILEIIWDLREKGEILEETLAASKIGSIVLENKEMLLGMKLIDIVEGKLNFTDEGEKRARNLTRRHRLAERMLTDLFEIPRGRIEDPSCEFEHILSEEVTDSICSFLGHPTKCPHGKPIPPGDCCNKMEKIIRPLVMPLSDLMPGEKGRIVFIASKDGRRLQKLSSFGIAPDGLVSVNQKLPTMVIQVGETEIALDKSLVSEIYVKRIGDKGIGS